jgi:hypothetical protein
MEAAAPNGIQSTGITQIATILYHDNSFIAWEIGIRVEKELPAGGITDKWTEVMTMYALPHVGTYAEGETAN